jgi:hypothetical protein
MKHPTNEGFLSISKSMTQIEDVWKDAYFQEANEITGHQYLRNGALVSGTWVRLNDGISASKGGWVPGRAEMGMLESRLEIDQRFMSLESDFEGFVERQAMPHYEGLANDMVDAIFTGTISGGYQFNGIESHIDDPAQTDQFSKSMATTYGATGSATSSILVVDWGPDKIYMVYPKGDEFLGVRKVERGYNERLTGNNSSTMYGYVCDFMWYAGLVVADDRCVRRICNIATAASLNNPLATTFTVYPIIDSLASMYQMGSGARMYMNREVWSILHKAAVDKTNVQYAVSNPWGAPERSFDGTGIGISDSLLNTETAI